MLSRLTILIKKLLPDYRHYETIQRNVMISKKAKLYFPVRLSDVKVEDYSYVGRYSHLKNVTVGKFCSIGPNCFFGWGIHPINGVSTSPMFYSTHNQNGTTLSKVDKVVEHKPIIIGNDVFIGMNVTILDGVTIGDGAVIGAGALVSKDIPAYAIAYGNPISVVRYRFSPEIIEELKTIKWWDFNDENLKLIEQDFFNIEQFIEKAKKISK
jgi:virginiamycin A acetyltransferase